MARVRFPAGAQPPLSFELKPRQRCVQQTDLYFIDVIIWCHLRSPPPPPTSLGTGLIEGLLIFLCSSEKSHVKMAIGGNIESEHETTLAKSLSFCSIYLRSAFFWGRIASAPSPQLISLANTTPRYLYVEAQTKSLSSGRIDGSGRLVGHPHRHQNGLLFPCLETPIQLPSR